MNGFQDELKSRILSVTSHIEITKPGKDLNNWQQTKETIANNMDIKGVSPYVADQAMISVGKRNRGVMVRGIFPEIEKDVNDINTKISSGAYRLNAGQYNIIIGVDLARYLGVSKKLMKFIPEKGSVALNGTSLTVNNVVENIFYINLIPHTLLSTNLSSLKIGSMVNIEIDMIARYLQNFCAK
jgi:ABC-type lipoprotein release transport system permease subunit